MPKPEARLSRRILVHLAFERGVVHRVVDGDDLAVDVEREGNVHVAAERTAHALADHRLAVSGRSVEKYRFPGVDRRTKLFEQPRLDDQVGEPSGNPLPIDVPRDARSSAI